MFRRVLLLALLVSFTILPAPAAAQTTHIVNQVGTTFVSADITITVGDTVRWVHSSGIHTVTSGTGAGDPSVGELFDAPLSAAASSFEFVFTEEGNVRYFCRPHAFLEMKGVIRVEPDATPAPPAAASMLRMQSIQPNPFNPRALVRFALGSAGPVTIVIHDSRGRLVRRLTDATHMEAGDQQVVWDGRSENGSLSPSGVYYFRVRTRAAEQSTRGVLVR